MSDTNTRLLLRMDVDTFKEFSAGVSRQETRIADRNACSKKQFQPEIIKPAFLLQTSRATDLVFPILYLNSVSL